jgi:hypothetical protein
MANIETEILPLTHDPYVVGPGISQSPTSPSAVSHGLPRSASAVPTELPLITIASSAVGIVSAMSPGGLQSPLSTITSAIAETPESTLATPAPITETTNVIVTVTTPPLITSTGLTTLPDGAVVTTTQVIANPLQGPTGFSSDHS